MEAASRPEHLPACRGVSAPRGRRGGARPAAAAAPARRRRAPPARGGAAASSSDFGPASCGGGRRQSRISSRVAAGRRRRRRAGAAPAGPPIDPRPRREHGRVDRAQHPHVAGELDDDARRAVGAACPGARPQALGDLALDHHRPAPQRRQLGDRPQEQRRRDRVGQVGDHRGRRRLERGQVDPHRVAPEISTPGRAAPRRGRSALRRRRSSSISVDVARPPRRGARSARPPRPRPRARRRPASSAASRTIASSRFGSARKFWPSRTTLPAEQPRGVRLDRRAPARS